MTNEPLFLLAVAAWMAWACMRSGWPRRGMLVIAVIWSLTFFAAEERLKENCCVRDNVEACHSI